jgi:glucose/arabinose dehydrogenase
MLSRRALVVLAVAGASVGGLLFSAADANAATRGAKVVRAIDGDTVKVRSAGRVRTVHLAGVRAHMPRTCKGRLATRALRRLLPRGRRVRLVAPRRALRARALRAEVYLGGRARARSVSRAQVVRGVARVRTTTRLRSRYHAAYRRAQAAARTRSRGIWGSACAPSRGSAPSAPPPIVDPGPPLPRGFGLEQVVGGLAAPVEVTGRPGTGDLIVAEQRGLVKVVRSGAALPAPMLDLSGVVDQSRSETGLLGLAFHPDHATNGLFYVHYVDSGLQSRVVEYRVAPGSDVAAPVSAREILAQPQPGANHNGGKVTFGPDGYLYISLGDGGADAAQSQNLGTLHGSILRIDVNRTSAGLQYAIPPDNPFVSLAGARPEIWAFGLRNPWRFSFDRATGALWIGDVGEQSREEIDMRAAGAGGANFGWNAFEGSLSGSGSLLNGPHVPPVAQYTHTDGNCSVTGGHVYRGPRVPGLAGRYVYADFCSGKVWALDAALTGGPVEITGQLGTGLPFVRTFGEDLAGELYAADASSIYRFVAREPSP